MAVDVVGPAIHRIRRAVTKRVTEETRNQKRLNSQRDLEGKVAIALAQITRSLAVEAIEHGIRVNAVGAGDVVTNLLNSFRENGQAFPAELGKAAPIKGAAQPEEIAEVIAFLASGKASFMVGSIVMADGGMSIAIPSE